MTAEWVEQAACRDMEPGVFQADEPEYDEQLALSACFDCPVRDRCLSVALEIEGSSGAQRRYGIVGGLTPGDRAKLDRRVRRGGNADPDSKWSDRLSDQEHAFRREWHAQGLLDSEIANLCKVSPTTIQKWRQLYGLPANQKQAPKDVMVERARLMDEGWSNRDIAAHEGCHVDAIRAWRARREKVSA